VATDPREGRNRDGVLIPRPRSSSKPHVQITAKTDYAVRALLMLAQATPELVKLDVLVAEQEMPRRFVESILSELRRAGLVRSQRGSDGGYGLALPAEEITLGRVIRIVDGPIADGPGARPHELSRIGVAEHLPDVWVAMWASLRTVLDETTLRHVLSGKLPEHVARLSRVGHAGTALSSGTARA
jgi:Rrf2 family protein